MSFSVSASAGVISAEQSVSALVPKTAELIIGALGFLVLLWLLKKFAYPMF